MTTAKLFEFIVSFDGAQAGLSWSTILNKRENYRAAFDQFLIRAKSRATARKKSPHCWPTPASSATA